MRMQQPPMLPLLYSCLQALASLYHLRLSRSIDGCVDHLMSLHAGVVSHGHAWYCHVLTPHAYEHPSSVTEDGIQREAW